MTAFENAPVAGGGGVQRRQQPAQQQEGGANAFLSILNKVVFFFAFQSLFGMAKEKFMPQQQSNMLRADVPKSGGGEFGNIDNVDIDNKKTKPIGVTTNNNNNNRGNRMMLKPACLWQQGTVMDLDVLITDSPYMPDGWPALTTLLEEDGDMISMESPKKKDTHKTLASWHQDGLVLGGEFSSGPDTRSGFSSFLSSNANQDMNHRNTTLSIPMTQSMWNNETHVYAYVKLQRRRNYKNKDPSKKMPVRKEDVLVKRMMLTRHRKRKKTRDIKSLLDTPSSELESTIGVDPNDNSLLTKASLNKTHEQLLLYMKPSLTLQLVDFSKVDFPAKQSVPKQFLDHMDWYTNDNSNNGPPQMQDFYYPILYQSEFWITFASLKEVNGSLKESKLDVTYEPSPVSLVAFILCVLVRINHTLTLSFDTMYACRCGSGSYRVKPKLAGVSRSLSQARKMKGMIC